MNSPAPQHVRPLWAAALLTGLIVPVGYFLLALIVGLFSGDSISSEMNARMLGFVLFFGLPVSMGAMVLLGLPVALVLRRFEMLTAGKVCVGATLIGGGVLSAFYQFADADSPFGSFWGCVVGLMAGVVFCAVAGIRWRSADA